MDSQPFGVGNCSSSSCNVEREDHQKMGLVLSGIGSYFITRPSDFQSATSEDRLVVKPLGPEGNQCVLVLPRDVQQVMISGNKRPND